MRVVAAVIACTLLAACSPQRHVVTETTIEILQPVRFAGATAELSASDQQTLDAVASTMSGNPNLRVVAVHAYGADAAQEIEQRQLGEDRAKAIVEYLVAHGVERTRLRAVGEATPPPGQNTSFEIVERGSGS